MIEVVSNILTETFILYLLTLRTVTVSTTTVITVVTARVGVEAEGHIALRVTLVTLLLTICTSACMIVTPYA